MEPSLGEGESWSKFGCVHFERPDDDDEGAQLAAGEPGGK